LSVTTVLPDELPPPDPAKSPEPLSLRSRLEPPGESSVAPHQAQQHMASGLDWRWDSCALRDTTLPANDCPRPNIGDQIRPTRLRAGFDRLVPVQVAPL
jgi:hypothetical protein